MVQSGAFSKTEGSAPEPAREAEQNGAQTGRE